jgi:prevent-host-death family protein
LLQRLRVLRPRISRQRRLSVRSGCLLRVLRCCRSGSEACQPGKSAKKAASRRLYGGHGDSSGGKRDYIEREVRAENGCDLRKQRNGVSGQMTTFPCHYKGMKNRVVNVTEFKARCLALLEDVSRHGGSITITKRGRPLASVVPARRQAWKSPEGSWVGKVSIADDLEEMDTAELWDVLRTGAEI